MAPSFAPDAEFDADRGAIQGQVVDEEAVPVVGIKLLLMPSKAVAETALDGGFTFSFLDPGKHTILYSHLGYESGTLDIDVLAGEATEVEIQLVAIAVAHPRTETLPYTGFLECRWASFGSGKCFSTGICLGSTCYTTQPVADLVWTQDKNEFFFKLTGEDWQEIVIETRWEPSSLATNPKTTTLFSYQGRPGNHEFGSSSPMESPGWWNYTKGVKGQNARPDNPPPEHKEPTLNHTLRAWLAVSGDILAAPYDEEGPAGAMYQTKYDMFVTVFYSQRAPEGYTAFVD